MDYLNLLIDEQSIVFIVIFLFGVVTGVTCTFASKKIYPIARKKIIAARIRFLITLNKLNKKKQDVESDQNWIPFPIAGWHIWGELKVNELAINSISVNGNVDLAGYVSITIDPVFKGKTLKIQIDNSNQSVFSGGEMLKITYNQDDRCLKPYNIPYLITNQYLPCGDMVAYYRIPEDLDNKIGFVFYSVELKDLRITAFFK